MKHTTTRHWLTALQYLIDADDAPPAAQNDAQRALDAYARAQKLHADEQHTAHATLQALHSLERELPRLALQHVQAGKRLNLDTQLREIDQTRNASTQAQERARITLHVERACEGQVNGACLRPHHDTLLHWVATRRNANPYQCGQVDTLPEQVQVIYNQISPAWWNQWDEGLTLNAISRLPLLYQADWDTDVRASLAWVWEQVATGQIDTIPHPHARVAESAPRLHVPSRRFIQLPNVPPAVHNKQVSGFFF